jgi:hypothetical protein
MTSRTLARAVVAAALVAALAARAAAQTDVQKFATEFHRAFELKDEKGLDKLLKSTRDMPYNALIHFQEIRAEVWSGKTDLQPKVDMMKAAWQRVFESATALEKLERWIESQDPTSWQTFRKCQGNVHKAWAFFNDATGKDNTKRKPFEESRDLLLQAAQQMEATGNKIEASHAWNLLSVCLHRMPERTLQDRRDAIDALEQFMSLRQTWEWTGDSYYLQNQNTLKSLKVELELKTKEGDKRAAEGYAKDAKGIDALAMPGVAEVKTPLQFEPVAAWDQELDYCQRGGPVPPLWWYSTFGKDDKQTKINWFRRMPLHLVRLSAAKFAVSTLPEDEKRNQAIDVGTKAKPSLFHLDPEGKVPYAMFFWYGSDRERLGEVDVNLAPADANTPVYYRSASSWTATVAGEVMTFYDDNTSGQPMDSDPFAGDFRMVSLGFAKDDARSVAPLLDSMRVGKGPRVPFSEFVQLAAGWHYVKIDNDKVGARPLNAEYLKLGKVKLVWSGPKPTAPVQLVIKGSGDFKSALFDVASGKEVEVPSGEYSVIWGRIVQGKGSRVQVGTIYAADSKPFTVEAGKTFDLAMGAPFSLEFEKKGENTAVEIDGSRIWLREQSGCVVAELHGLGLAPEVLAAKAEDGKGARTIGKFVRCTDPEQLNLVVPKLGDLGLLAACLPMPEHAKENLVWKGKLPAAGMKVALSMKKHPLFGKLESAWK